MSRPRQIAVTSAAVAGVVALAAALDRTVVRRRYGASTLARLGRATTVLTVRPGGHAK